MTTVNGSFEFNIEDLPLMNDLTNAVFDKIDIDDIVNNIDLDDLAREVYDNIDIDDLAERVQGELDYDQIADEVESLISRNRDSSLDEEVMEDLANRYQPERNDYCATVRSVNHALERALTHFAQPEHFLHTIISGIVNEIIDGRSLVKQEVTESVSFSLEEVKNVILSTLAVSNHYAMGTPYAGKSYEEYMEKYVIPNMPFSLQPKFKNS